MTALLPTGPVIDRHALAEAAEPDACRLCNGSGWYQWSDEPTGSPEWVRCGCGAGEDAEREHAAQPEAVALIEDDDVPW